MLEKHEKAAAPPYVAFKTFWNFLERLGEIGTPPRIDRSVWGDRLSGAYGSQLMAAMRFLGLIDEAGNADPELRGMAEDREFRPIGLQARLETAYRPAIEDLDLSQATMQQLQDKFRETYSVSGETFDKAISFFTHAAKAAGIHLSPYIERSMKKRTMTGKPKRKRKTVQPKGGAAKPSANGSASDTNGGGDAHHRIVTLRTGGTVKLTLDYNPFKLDDPDRTFVFGLIDMIQTYETGGGEATE